MDTTPAPDAPKSRSTLDTAANIAIILVCIVAVFYLSLQIRDRFTNRQGPAAAPPQGAAVGDQFDALVPVIPAGAERALVVAISPTCHFCTESMPFYKRLVEERNAKGSKTKVIAAVPREEVKADEERSLTGAGVAPDALVVVDFAAIKVPGTPTILHVDGQGKVLDVWVGKQSSGGEEEILAKL
ncbi:MAG TPA: hypothetical protein DD490_18405 [Acidobacteria bacterium]|nr:hypothetical protein [Acidobacteriota bacterium]